MACSKDLARRQREEQRAGVAGVVCGKEIAARGEHLQFVQMVLVGGGCGWPAAHHCGGWSWNFAGGGLWKLLFNASDNVIGWSCK